MIAARPPRERGARGIALSRARSGASPRQYGFGVILLLAVVASLGAVAALLSFSRPNSLPLENERKTADALAAAKEALIGYAVSRGKATCSIVEDFSDTLAAAAKREACRLEGLAERPGELPCPDVNGDGFEDAPCNSVTGANLVGRLPWRTLGVPRLVDAEGEPLWYMISGPFRRYASNPLPAGNSSEIAAKHINSDTRGNIAVFTEDLQTGAVAQSTNSAVAVIFAPGGARSAQNRSAVAGACTLPGGSVVGNLCPSAYLESLTARVSPPVNGPFFDVTIRRRGGASNDGAIYITTSEFIAALEIRVGNEVKKLLTAYEQNSSCRCFPWADNWEYSGGIADEGQSRGRLGTDVGPEQWGTGAVGDDMPRLPPWLGANNWNNLIWYTVSGAFTPAGKCKTCSVEPVTVNNQKVAALFFLPGTPRDGIARILPLYGARVDTLSLYLHDAQNSDAANTSNPACPNVGDLGHGASVSPPSRPGAAACDRYVEPTSTARDRNRLFTIGAANAAICTSQSQRLLAAAPCGVGYSGQSVNPQCLEARVNLRLCSCSQAAQDMLEVPCRNNSSSSHCPGPTAALAACTP
jgi:hypothetical protein